ncbi:MAG: hypothetical protein IPM49_16635 [Flavobacteriales bacterium]|nr:hypothetical protein [Flavobacteriales bacterium]
MYATRLLLRSLVLAGVGVLAVLAAGAQDRGLSGEFSQLSAKERSRLAREEIEAALKDTAFQATMARAEAHFQARRYEVAMADYERARALRPLNVYPPVKIDDLRVLIAKRDAAVAQARADSAARSVPPPEPPVVREEEVAERAPSPPEQPVVTAPGTAPAQVVEAAPPEPVPPRPRATPQARPAPTPVVRPDVKGPEPPVPAVREPGIHEEQFKEGNAIVLQRTVTTATEVHIYRKVTHPWGRTFHFLDGLPVDERAWTERFGDR